MSFIADLHIHSRFSMATSKNLSLPLLAGWAMRKGINVLGTGDFTHPAWMRELEETLCPAKQEGLYKLKQPPLLPPGPEPLAKEPLFCLQTEISCIYKKSGKTRKVHNLIYMPDLEAAKSFSIKLAKIGNLGSDGRPILALDSRDLLEIALESASGAVLIPAHIWTPWFALFGSKSGFDQLEDCYGDLSDHIFALETGLSSDPPMNRMWSKLDNYALISNSDAHSGSNLGREANFFSGEPGYHSMFNALKIQARREDAMNGCSFLGTLEFFPQEGKYHLDGHRNCGISLTPEESRELNNLCPVCGKPLTIGVLHRVTALADRAHPARLTHEPETRMLVPMPEIVAQIVNKNPQTKLVNEICASIANRLGPELEVLCLKAPEEIAQFWPILGEAITRIRSGRLKIKSGFDGEYGEIGIFEPGETGQINKPDLPWNR